MTNDTATVLQLIEDYAKAVHDGDDSACIVLKRTLEASLEQISADEWLAQQRGPLTTPRISINYASDFMDFYVQFAKTFGIPKGNLNQPLDHKHLVRAIDHVAEEHDEMMCEAAKYLQTQTPEQLAKLAGEVVDCIYVLCQLAYMFDLPLKASFLEVHNANMRKVGPNGEVRRREDGKILKPEGWTPPNLLEVIQKYSRTRPEVKNN